MHPTQRKLMKRIILFLSLQFPITYPAIAGQDIDLVANVKNSTCKSGISNQGNIDLGVVGVGYFSDNVTPGISNQGNIDLGVVGVGYFSDNVTPESYQPGGKEFTVTVSDCALQGTGDVLNQLHIDFRALSGVMAAGSRQIFANEVATGAKNVGVVLFSIQDPTNIFNVISSAGNSRSVYPVMTSALHNSSWKFYARMQKIDPALDVISGQVMSHILVDVYYE
ncbi:TPA: fimbrial protein StaF [Escherichia coli]|nr:fimbrial protein StaF [Escherichia coli]